jgi:hypothetical protein
MRGQQRERERERERERDEGRKRALSINICRRQNTNRMTFLGFITLGPREAL